MEGKTPTSFEAESQSMSRALVEFGDKEAIEVIEVGGAGGEGENGNSDPFKARRSVFELERDLRVVSVPRSDEKRWVGYTCIWLTLASLVVGAVGLWIWKMEEGCLEGSLTGETGVISEYEGVSEEEARARIREMVKNFNIQNFEFRDAFGGSYSYAPPPEATEWKSPHTGQVVRRATLEAFLAEIHDHGGQAWLEVQAMAVDSGGCENRDHCKVLEKHRIGGKTPVDLVSLSMDWAYAMAWSWANFAEGLKFKGIQWNMIRAPLLVQRQDVSDFLYATRPVLEEHGLKQVSNFIDGFGWKPEFILDKVLEFPYWTVWTVPVAEDAFFANTLRVKGVFVCYPGQDAEHKDEKQNIYVKGMAPVDVLKVRWQKAREHGNAYLGVADGRRIVQPHSRLDDSRPIELADAEVETIRKTVFASESSGIGISDAIDFRKLFD
mmetsp:Transcript_82270/g.180898  ORF Transcript_82270/g.180898 Transcript_82270/m.180898 type:complete len:437 (+) Transcript_82270:172-1482(+)